MKQEEEPKKEGWLIPVLQIATPFVLIFLIMQDWKMVLTALGYVGACMAIVSLPVLLIFVVFRLTKPGTRQRKKNRERGFN